MDPPTHGLLGAAIGQAFFARALGRRALVAGAALAMAPDVDVALIGSDPLDEWIQHRGVTHALWFSPAIGAVAGTLLARAFGRRDGKSDARGAWIALAITCMLSHPLLDSCTSYGTQLLAPFSRHRYAIDALPIIDPLVSLVLLAALVAGWVWSSSSSQARVAAKLALVFFTGYLAYGLRLNQRAEQWAVAQLANEGIAGARVRAFPTLLQIHLRRIVALRGDDVWVGWLTLWRPGPIAWERFTQARGTLVDAATASPEGRVLDWFAEGITTASVIEEGGAASHPPSTPPPLRRSESGSAASLSPNAGKVVEIDDLRFGLPARPREGLWGLRFHFDEFGRISQVERIDRPLPAPVSTLLREVWRTAFPSGEPGRTKRPPG